MHGELFSVRSSRFAVCWAALGVAGAFEVGGDFELVAGDGFGFAFPDEAGVFEGGAVGAEEGQEALAEVVVMGVFADGERLDGAGDVFGEGDGVEVLGCLLDADLVDDGGVESPGAHLIDEEVGGGDLDDDVFHDAVEEVGGFEHGLGHETEGGLFGIADAEFEAGLGEVGEGGDFFGVAFGGGDDDGGLGEEDGFGELVGDGGDEADVTGVVGVGHFGAGGFVEGFHGSTEDAAAVEDGGDIDALAVGELLDEFFDGGAIDAAGVEDEFGLGGEGITEGGDEVVGLHDGGAFVGGGEVAGELEGEGGLGGGGEDGGAGVFAVAAAFGEFDGFKVLELMDGGVPDDGGVDGSEGDVGGDFGDAGFHHGGGGGEGGPTSFTEEFAGDFADAGGVGIGEGEFGGLEGGEVGDGFGVAFFDGDDGVLDGDGEGFVDEVESGGIREGGVVGGDEEVAHFSDLDLAEQSAGAAVLERDGGAGVLLELEGEGFDGFLETGGAVDGEGGGGIGFGSEGLPDEEGGDGEE